MTDAPVPRPRIFSSASKLAELLGHGARLTVNGSIKPDLTLGASFSQPAALLSIGGFPGDRYPPAPPIFWMPVHAMSIDGALAEISAMCDGTLSGALIASAEQMGKAGYRSDPYRHTGGVGRARIADVCRLTAHLVMEWTAPTLSDVAERKGLGFGWWVPPERAAYAEEQFNRTKMMVGHEPLPQPWTLVHGPQGCFLKREMPPGSLYGRVRIR